jgi:hypothetical protein
VDIPGTDWEQNMAATQDDLAAWAVGLLTRRGQCAPDAAATLFPQKTSVDQAATSSRPRVNVGAVFGHAVE